MKSEQIKDAFSAIANEAAHNEALTRQITERLSDTRGVVPTAELKKLFWQFVLIMVPTAALYLVITLINVPTLGTIELESLAEHDSIMVWQTIDFTANGYLLLIFLARGLLRAFSILLVLTFLLTAAAMPVQHHKTAKGGLPCAA